MIVAGVGFRQSVAAEEIVALVTQALGRATLAPEALDHLATIEPLAGHPAFIEAARRLSLRPISVDDARLSQAASRVRTASARSLAAHGVCSVAEAAALGGAGPHSRLLLERIASAAATCALAESVEAAP